MYATAQDIIERYTLDELIVISNSDNDSGDDYDTTQVSRALEDASSEIDGWLSHCYDTPIAMPLTGKFIQLTAICVDIAVCRLGFSMQVATDEKDQRYDKAIKRLGLLCPKAKQVMSGKVENLGATGKAISVGGKRVFSRQSQRGLL